MISSLLDNDLYTFTVGQVAFHRFANVRVSYKLINRGPGNPLEDKQFCNKLNSELLRLDSFSMTKDEVDYLRSLGYFDEAYLEFLSTGRLLNYDDLEWKDGTVYVNGPWFKTIFWEVALLATYSELYHKYNQHERPSVSDTPNRIDSFDVLGLPWCDFGTRRRFSYDIQDEIVCFSKYSKNFLGTSNTFLAKRHGVKPIGTMSHQGPMALQAIYSPTLANSQWAKVWQETYGSKLNTFLPDTLTTDWCLTEMFDVDTAKRWNWRHDSGCPLQFVRKLEYYYNLYNLDAKDVTIIFSDSLTVEKIKSIEEFVAGRFKAVYAVGTNLTNNWSAKALNIVVKLDTVNGVNVVKLSDEPGKYTGDKNTIKKIQSDILI